MKTFLIEYEKREEHGKYCKANDNIVKYIARSIIMVIRIIRTITEGYTAEK